MSDKITELETRIGVLEGFLGIPLKARVLSLDEIQAQSTADNIARNRHEYMMLSQKKKPNAHLLKKYRCIKTINCDGSTKDLFKGWIVGNIIEYYDDEVAEWRQRFFDEHFETVVEP